jgi:hypothetical protein
MKGESKMEKFIRKPSIDMHLGIRVTKDFKADFKTENVEQHIVNLVLHQITKVKGDGFESTYDTTIYLNEGDVLIYEEDRGYIKPVDSFMTVREAIEDFEAIKDL